MPLLDCDAWLCGRSRLGRACVLRLTVLVLALSIDSGFGLLQLSLRWGKSHLDTVLLLRLLESQQAQCVSCAKAVAGRYV